MSKFTKELEAFIKEHGYKIFNGCEIKDGEFSSFVIRESCPCLNSYSVAKVFVVTALGMLFDDGKLDTSEKILDILGELCPKNICPEYRELTLEQVILHKMGLPGGYLDIDSNPPELYGSNFLENVLTTKPIYTPGSGHSYSDGAYYLLARVVQIKSGMPLERFLWERLFSPLNFREAAFSTCPMGHAMGATGLYIYSTDMAKLGQLYLNGGIYNNRKILSENWVNTVFEKGYELQKCCGGKAYGKGGMFGQMLLIFPERRQVVAWHAFEKCDFSPLMDFIENYE